MLELISVANDTSTLNLSPYALISTHLDMKFPNATQLILVIGLLCLSLAPACESEDDAPGESENEYQLVARLRDPGDGSGGFRPTSHSRTIKIYADSTFRASEDLCEFTGGDPSEGRLSANGRIDLSGCNQFPLRYELLADTFLLYYPCFEGCIDKYIRL